MRLDGDFLDEALERRNLLQLRRLLLLQDLVHLPVIVIVMEDATDPVDVEPNRLPELLRVESEASEALVGQIANGFEVVVNEGRRFWVVAADEREALRAPAKVLIA